MAQQNLNLGTSPNDGTGDALRISLQKVQSNTTELYTVKQNIIQATSTPITAASTSLSATNKLILIDTTTNNVSITLPVAPVDDDELQFKIVTVGIGRQVSILCSGSQVFNKTGGLTTFTFSILNQFIRLKFKSGIWIISDANSIEQLDLRYINNTGAGINNNPITSFAPNTLSFTQKIKEQNYLKFYDQKFSTWENSFNRDNWNNFIVGASVGIGTLARTLGEVINYTNNTNGGYTFYGTGVPVKAPFVVCEAVISSYPASGVTNSDAIFLGIMKTTGTTFIGAKLIFNAGNYVIELSSQQASLQGTQFPLSGLSQILGKKLTVVIINNSIAAYISSGDNYSDLTFIGTITFTNTDLRVESTINSYVYGCFFQVSNTTNSLALSKLNFGYSACSGISSQTLATYENGEPIIKNGKCFLLVESAVGASACNFTASVFEMDLKSFEIRQIAIHLFRKDANILGNTSGHLVFDRDTQKWRYVIGNWAELGGAPGTTAVNIWYGEFYENLLYGFHILDGMVPLPIPTTKSVYDPSIIKINGVWYIGYTESGTVTNWSTFYAAMSSCIDFAGTITYIGTDLTRVNSEGQKFIKIGGVYYMASQNNTNIAFYNLSMGTVGTTPSPFSNSGAPGHAVIIPTTQGLKTRYILIQFNINKIGGINWSHGNQIIYDGNVVNGWEWAPKSIN